MNKTIAIIAVLLIIIGVTGVSFLKTNRHPITELNTCIGSCSGDRSKYVVKVYEGIQTKTDCDKLNGVYKQLDDEETYCQVK